MLAIGTGIREHLHVDSIELSIGIGAEPHFDTHLVAGEGCFKYFAAREGKASGSTGLHSDHCDIRFDMNVLFSAKSSAYPGFYNTNLSYWHLEG